MGDITRDEMATYYAVRRLTNCLGVMDSDWSRPTIPRKKRLGEITRKEYEICLLGELDLIKAAFKYLRFDIEMKERERVAEELVQLMRWRSEALRSRDEIRSYRISLGLDPEKS